MGWGNQSSGGDQGLKKGHGGGDLGGWGLAPRGVTWMKRVGAGFDQRQAGGAQPAAARSRWVRATQVYAWRGCVPDQNGGGGENRSPTCGPRGHSAGRRR
jgi:hypothetical protein